MLLSKPSRWLVPFMTLLLISGCGSSGGASSPPPPLNNDGGSTPTPPPTPPETETTDNPAIPTGGDALLADNAISVANLWEGDGTEPVGNMSIINVEHDYFDQALQVNVTNPSGVSWNGQIQLTTTADINVGDKLLLHVFFRTLSSQYETGTGFAGVSLQGGAPDYPTMISRNINSASEWVEYFFPVEMTQAYKAGSLYLNFNLGGGDKPQSFQIADIQLINYQQTVALADLPVTKPTYVGRESDADWRVAAQQRIEQYRKGDFTLTVQTADGDKVANTDIHINMTKHAYQFGSAIVSSALTGNSEDDLIYQQKVTELFNEASTENDLKWPAWIGEWDDSYNQQTTIAGLQWLQDRGFYTRGHVLVWPSKRNLPKIMQPYLPKDDPANADPQALQLVNEHIDDVTLKTANLLQEWDVLNEPFDNHYLMDAFGKDIMVDWFNRARHNLPEHKLYINDYSILSSAGLDISHQQVYQDTIQYLVDQGAPIDGIGLQSHFSEILTGIPKLYSIIERFHTAFPNLTLRSTEFDIKTDDEQLQADYTRDFMTLFFSHPATVGIQLWGFWAGRHWYPEAALYDLDWREKPNAVVWKDLIFNQWHSQFDGQTDAQGQFSQRGFYGDYTATVDYAGSSYDLTFSIDKNSDNNIVLTLAN